MLFLKRMNSVVIHLDRLHLDHLALSLDLEQVLFLKDEVINVLQLRIKTSATFCIQAFSTRSGGGGPGL